MLMSQSEKNSRCVHRISVFSEHSSSRQLFETGRGSGDVEFVGGGHHLEDLFTLFRTIVRVTMLV